MHYEILPFVAMYNKPGRSFQCCCDDVINTHTSNYLANETTYSSSHNWVRKPGLTNVPITLPTVYKGLITSPIVLRVMSMPLIKWIIITAFIAVNWVKSMCIHILPSFARKCPEVNRCSNLVGIDHSIINKPLQYLLHRHRRNSFLFLTQFLQLFQLKEILL